MAATYEAGKAARAGSSSSKHAFNTSDGPVPLTTSKLGNTAAREQTANKKQKIDHLPTNPPKNLAVSMEAILAKLSEQQAILETQKNTLSTQDPSAEKTQASEARTPTQDTTRIPLKNSEIESTKDVTKKAEPEDVLRLQRELEAAKSKIARQEQELSQSRAPRQIPAPILTNAIPAPFNSITSGGAAGGGFIGNLSASSRSIADEAQSEISDTFSVNTTVPRPQTIWASNGNGLYGDITAPLTHPFPQQGSIWGQPAPRRWGNRPPGQPMPSVGLPQAQSFQQRTLSGPSSPTSGRFGNDFYQGQGQNQGLRRSNTQSSRGSMFSQPRGSDWDGYSQAGDIAGLNGMTSIGNFQQPMGMFQSSSPVFSQHMAGTALSPTAAEFSLSSNPSNPWNSLPSSPGQTYVSPMEPINYRRLLDRTVTCNWKYIVDKIVCNNDQQASIFLQQKLKIGSVEQKFEIVEAIVAQAYPLMVNRFGNFLVQRCFEHGTPEQVVAIANAIRGNTLTLSMDAFGCHVVQKAFDAVPEEFKAIFVHELLRRIPETVIHRYACHVWQKLFELRWSDSPPQIMKYVNEALRGMWHEVALGETGSLVVQNIFENCLEEDKRPCINEVLNSIDIVAHGQFGNWCIQHICEHGAPADRSRAIDHVLRYATEYSMDQFASKVVEKCLKIGGGDFLERYLERVCEGRPDRPRIPLIDIASDQYGNYLIQWILTHANAQHREIVAPHIRKHMVSLRGSKFGSRVGMLCCNPAYATRPGPGAGPPVNRFNGANVGISMQQQQPQPQQRYSNGPYR
ncbi:hypothetical protein MMC25_000882 [Agyrium rufum]|nr:hypothetical protein [Agyrium rufum]